MTSYHQYPPPFELRDEVVTEDGLRFSGNRARVYWLLRLTADRKFRHRIGAQRGPGGCVPSFLFTEPWAGGSEGKRRVRELRELYDVEFKIDDFVHPSGESSNTQLYRITKDPLRSDGRRRPSDARPAPLFASSGPERPPANGSGNRSGFSGLRFRLFSGQAPAAATVITLPGPTPMALTEDFYRIELAEHRPSPWPSLDVAHIAVEDAGTQPGYDPLVVVRGLLTKLGAEEVSE